MNDSGKCISFQELEEFVGGAREGLILFSFGSIVKPHELPEETRRAFVSVFSRLKQRVLWKWTKDMPDLPKNVKLAKWVPQQDVLGIFQSLYKVESCYNEHANNEFNRYNEHTFWSSHVKIMLCAMLITKQSL